MGSDGSSNLFIGFGVLALAVALLLWWLRHRKAAETEAVRSVAVGTAAAAAASPPGTHVAVEGVVRCAAALMGELSQTRCVYFRSKVEDNWEEERKGSDGERTMESRSTIVSDTTRQTPFAVEDQSGSVQVLPEGARVHAPSSFHRREGNPGGLGSWNRSNVTRTFEEWALAVDTPVYVLGVVQPGGALGGGGKHAFLIDHQSGEQRLTANVKALWWFAVVAAALLVVGVALVAYGVVSR